MYAYSVCKLDISENSKSNPFNALFAIISSELTQQRILKKLATLVYSSVLLIAVRMFTRHTLNIHPISSCPLPAVG
jgi:hypothetical protein